MQITKEGVNMDEKEFQSLMLQARKKAADKNWEYSVGYVFGLRHRFYAGTDIRHAGLENLINDDPEDEALLQAARGYRDGYNGLTPSAERWEELTKCKK